MIKNVTEIFVNCENVAPISDAMAIEAAILAAIAAFGEHCFAMSLVESGYEIQAIAA